MNRTTVHLCACGHNEGYHASGLAPCAVCRCRGFRLPPIWEPALDGPPQTVPQRGPDTESFRIWPYSIGVRMLVTLHADGSPKSARFTNPATDPGARVDE